MTLANPPLQRCSYCKEINTRSGLSHFPLQTNNGTFIIRLCDTKCMKAFRHDLPNILENFKNKLNASNSPDTSQATATHKPLALNENSDAPSPTTPPTSPPATTPTPNAESSPPSL